MDNAFYDPATNGLYFGDGGGPTRINDLAREAAVIYHEYTHYVLDHINKHLKGSEADALHEGYADYFGCSKTGDPQIGEWVMAPQGLPHLRDLTTGKRYPEHIRGEAHADGEIWGGTCWAIRESVGKRTADTLIYESMHFLPEFAHFSDAVLGIFQADKNIYSGRHLKSMEQIVRNRGFTAGRET
jgi:Zn-dependent metalloprotease